MDNKTADTAQLEPCALCGATLILQGDYNDESAWNWWGHSDPDESSCLLAQHRVATLSNLTTPVPAEADRWNRRAAVAAEKGAELAELDRVLVEAMIEDPIGVCLTELQLERMDREEAATASSSVSPSLIPEQELCNYCASPDNFSAAVARPDIEGRWHQSRLGGHYRCAAATPTTATSAEQDLKKRARQIIDAVIQSPCVVEVRFFSQPQEAEKLEEQVAALLAKPIIPSAIPVEGQTWCDHCSADLNGIKHILCEQYYRDFANSINTRESLRGAILDWLAHRCDYAPVCGNCTYCRVAEFVRSLGPIDLSTSPSRDPK